MHKGQDKATCDPAPERAEPTAPVGRRRFLAASGACLLGVSGLAVETMAPAKVSAAPIVTPENMPAPSPLSIGYWTGSSENGPLGPVAALGRGRFRADVVDAARVPAESLDVACLTVYGLGGVCPTGPGPLGLTVYYAVNGKEAPFYAWTLDAISVGAPLCINVPVNSGALSLGLAPGGAAQAAGEDVRFTLVTDGGHGANRLRRGIYFVAFGAPRLVAALNWSRFQFREDPTERQVGHRLYRNALNRGPVPAEFYYLILGVETAWRKEG